MRGIPIRLNVQVEGGMQASEAFPYPYYKTDTPSGSWVLASLYLGLKLAPVQVLPCAIAAFNPIH